MPVLSIQANETNAISITYDQTLNVITDIWAGGSSPNGSFHFDYDAPDHPALVELAFTFPTPSLVDLPSNSIVSNVKLRYSYDIALVAGFATNSANTFVQIDPFETSFDSQNFLHFATNLIPVNINDETLNAVTTLPINRADLIAAYCKDPYVDGGGFPKGPFLFGFQWTIGGTSTGDFTTSDVFLDVTYTAPDPCWYNPLTNQWQAAPTLPGTDWHLVDCPSPDLNFSITPVFGSINGGD